MIFAKHLSAWEVSATEGGKGLRTIMYELALKRRAESPFAEEVIMGCRKDLAERLSGWGHCAEPLPCDRAQPLQVRLLQALLREARGPDAEVMEILAAGVPLGVDTELPRTPRVIEEKSKW
eukprot:1578384-Lingulodinium_polyedra.AAC.1